MAPDPKAVRQYLESQILTAPREDLLLLLFDGAIRFCEQARQRLSDQKVEEALHLLTKAQRIVLEVLQALDRGVGDDLYRNLAGLYGFAYLRLVRAGTKRDPAQLDEALAVLRRLREIWGEAVVQMRRERLPEVRILEQAQQKRASS